MQRPILGPLKTLSWRKLGEFCVFLVFFLHFGFGGGFGVYFRGVFWDSEGFCILYGGRMITNLFSAWSILSLNG